jgi:protein-S-isoprenylcysteine O-methyltransferase Ste14
MLVDRQVRIEDVLLGAVADAPAAIDTPAIEIVSTRQDPQQRALAGTVLAQDGDELSCMSLEARTTEHVPAPEALLDFLRREQHRRAGSGHLREQTDDAGRCQAAGFWSQSNAPCMGAFLLSKWYMDCVGDAGETVIAYAARLRWRSITLHYASVLIGAPGQPPRVETTMRASPEPELVGGILSWSSPALHIAGRWSSLAPPVEATIFESPEGRVEWRCHQPRAQAEITLGDRVVRGLGYTEHLVLSVEPWRMPIDQLRWGRFVGEHSALVWIDWRGGHTKQVVLLDGVDVGASSVGDRSVATERGDVRLTIEDGTSLRRGAIGTTALARVPGLERFPLRILAVDEQKWCARGTLDHTQGSDHGWVIHEVVRWPEAKAEPIRSRAGSGIGKVLYALLFIAVLPALLVAWARSTEAVIHAPTCRMPMLGAGVCALGAVLMVAGWAALWRHGGGLPMNAFPPPRLVTRGVYALVAHPIYVGFSAICFGVSIATGSASGLWLVSPAVALGAMALVVGYEQHDLEHRFGSAVTKPWVGLPPADESPPSIAQRLSALTIAVLPWTALSASRMRVTDVGVYLVALAAPFMIPSQRGLRTLVASALLAMPLVLPLYVLVPFIAPSLLVLLGLLAADAWTSRAPRARPLARAIALLLAAGDLAPARAGVTGVAVSVAVYAVVVNATALWRSLRSLAERVANSWHEARIGPVRIINHGMWAALATFGGIAIVGTLLGPGHTRAIVFAAAAGLVGAGVWAQTIEGSPALSRPYGFYGGVLGICLAALAAPLLGTPVWLLLGGYAVAGPYVQAMGRMRCLVQGCCHGRETIASIGIRYHHPRSRVCRLTHLAGVPVHATQLYSILWNGVTMVVVARLWSLHAALHLIGGVYLVLNGLGRFCEEAYRGEPQTPIVARLRLYQWLALGQVVVGAIITAVGVSGAAPTPAPNAPTLVAAVIFGVVNWFALGVDFPESNRRFSRLA